MNSPVRPPCFAPLARDCGILGFQSPSPVLDTLRLCMSPIRCACPWYVEPLWLLVEPVLNTLCLSLLETEFLPWYRSGPGLGWAGLGWAAIISPSVSGFSPVLLTLVGFIIVNICFPYSFGILALYLGNSFICCPIEVWYLKFSSEFLCLFWM